MNLVEISHLCKTYDQQVALNDVTLSLESGKIIGLLGPNGSGKTTLIKVLTGLLNKYTGEVTINGYKIGVQTKALVSYLPDKLYFEGWMKIKDIRAYFIDIYKDFDSEKFDGLLRHFRIEDRGLIKKLSKGNQEKLQLALVLSRNAAVYVFDEPIGGVDPALRVLLLETIMKMRNPESLIIFSTHQIYDVENLFDEVIFLNRGNVTLYKNTKELIEERGKSLLEIFKEEFKYDY